MGPDGKRLAKRNGGETLGDLRAAGVTPEAVRARLELTYTIPR
jgi:glutamyl-Q tRNA(Asp) synthetase